MKTLIKLIWLSAGMLFITSCSEEMPANEMMEEEVADADYPRGPNDGRLLESDNFAVELSIFETGVPPEFHAWPYYQGQPVPLNQVDLTVTLTRLGNELNVISFVPDGDHLRGDTVISEPHSFYVGVRAEYQGREYEWEYESLEGRTTISPQMTQAFGIETEIAGPATIDQYVNVVGEIVANDEFSRSISARFDGLVQSVNVRIGERVEQGDALIRVESNESLNAYTINAPITGIVSERYINPGEQTNGAVLLEIMDTSNVWAELSIFPSQRSQVALDAPVTITSPVSGATTTGTIDNFDMTVSNNQAITARVAVDNSDRLFPPGTFIEAQIKAGEFDVPLAVKRDGLQSFRDFTVVYEKIDNTYEVRMLELGQQDDMWIEVLGGLRAGAEYVTTNSYILKADVEKSGASHDH
tara:strand:+ start:240568 stop:241806 length:1239 start_codon:yes stop_codon:yes gene_type:complete